MKIQRQKFFNIKNHDECEIFLKKYDSNRFIWMKTMKKPHLRKNSPAKNAKYEKKTENFTSFR